MRGQNMVQLNDRGIVAVVGIILILVFGLGFMTNEAIRVGTSEREFTVEDAKRIVELQTIEDSKRNGAVIFGTKDKNGELIVHWQRDDAFDVGKH